MATVSLTLNDYVRLARRSDVRDVAKLLRDCFRETGLVATKESTRLELCEFGAGTNFRVDHLVAVSAGKVCGFLVMKPGPRLLEGEIEKLFVAPARRGAGVGTLLLEEAYAFARFRGYRWLCLQNGEPFTAARAWYLRHGWKQTPGARVGWFEREVPAIEWQRA